MSSRPLSAEERADLEALLAMDDESIDTVDIPELSEEQWANARRGAFYRSVEQQPHTVRLDADVVAWFKSHAADSGYQTEINRVLRRHVAEAEQKRG